MRSAPIIGSKRTRTGKFRIRETFHSGMVSILVSHRDSWGTSIRLTLFARLEAEKGLRRLGLAEA